MWNQFQPPGWRPFGCKGIQGQLWFPEARVQNDTRLETQCSEATARWETNCPLQPLPGRTLNPAPLERHLHQLQYATKLTAHEEEKQKCRETSAPSAHTWTDHLGEALV